jgi:ATP-dependent RNA helicase DDX27
MVDSQKKTVGTLLQEFVRLRPGREDSRLGYLVYICKKLYTERALIFFRQKKTAHRTRIIFGLLGLSCAELHGSMNQTQVSRQFDPWKPFPLLQNANVLASALRA